MSVITLGMHRSGTSALTRCLNLLGLSVGPEDDLIPASEENVKGFWENVELKKLNDNILEAFDGEWMDPI